MEILFRADFSGAVVNEQRKKMGLVTSFSVYYSLFVCLFVFTH